MEVRNPISDPAVLEVDGNMYPERRMQEIFDCWLADRFNGQEITVDGLAPGSTEQRTFRACNIQWGDSAPPGDDKPLLHLNVLNHGSGRRGVVPRVVQERHTYSVQVMVKVLRNLTRTEHDPYPDEIAREVMAELEWLLKSPERLALVVAGIEHPKVRAPSVEVPTSQWCARSILLEFTVRTQHPRQA